MLMGFGICLQNFLPDMLILLFFDGRLPVYIAVIGTAVDIEYLAKNGDAVLLGKHGSVPNFV